MKQLILIFTFIVPVFSISLNQRPYPDFYYESNYKKKYSYEEVKDFTSKVKKMSNEFVETARKYGVEVEYPHKKFKFAIMDWNNPLSGKYHPVLDYIELKKDFDKYIFFHELGHAEFKYSHDFDHEETDLENGLEDFKIASIMVWCPNLNIQRNTVKLDWDYYAKQFFTSSHFSKLNSPKGSYNHFSMIRRNALYLFVENPNDLTYSSFLNFKEIFNQAYFQYYRINYEYTPEGKMITAYEKYILSNHGKKEVLKKDINYEEKLLSDLKWEYERSLMEYNGELIAKEIVKENFSNLPNSL